MINEQYSNSDRPSLFVVFIRQSKIIVVHCYELLQQAKKQLI